MRVVLVSVPGPVVGWLVVGGLCGFRCFFYINGFAGGLLALYSFLVVLLLDSCIPFFHPINHLDTFESLSCRESLNLS